MKDIEKHLLQNEENILSFFEFIYDRQSIWHKRFIQEKDYPWTEDSVLQEYKFCNVYRRLDKGTQYLMETVVNHDTMTTEQQLLNIIGYRFFNKTGFFDWGLNGFFEYPEFDFDKYEKQLDEAKKERSIFSDAYMTTQQPFNKNYRWGDKHVQILHMLQHVCAHMDDYLKSIWGAQTPKRSWKAVKQVKMIGSFIGYEIWTDLTYLDSFIWTDNDFANPGPGAEWGLKIIFDREKITTFEAEEQIEIIRDSQRLFFEKLRERTGKNWKNVSWSGGTNGQYLSLRNIEHSLCEFRKYHRLKKGEGKKRIFRHPQKD